MQHIHTEHSTEHQQLTTERKEEKNTMYNLPLGENTQMKTENTAVKESTYSRELEKGEKKVCVVGLVRFGLAC